MLLTAGRLIKYDLKELFKKHIALYIVTLLAAFGCWALHMLSEYVPDNGITPVAYPVMIAVYVIVCVVLFIVSIVFVILYFRRSMLKDEGYLTHTLPVPVWLIYVCKLISGYIIYLVNFVVIVVSVCIAIARVDWIWRVPESINEQLNVRLNLSRGFSAKYNVFENRVQNIRRADSPQRLRIIGSKVFFYL